jgi:hypothetical protein
MDGRPRARRVPLHREMTTLTRSCPSSTVAPRSRRQRHGRKHLEKHGQGCAAGSAVTQARLCDSGTGQYVLATIAREAPWCVFHPESRIGAPEWKNAWARTLIFVRVRALFSREHESERSFQMLSRTSQLPEVEDQCPECGLRARASAGVQTWPIADRCASTRLGTSARR